MCAEDIETGGMNIFEYTFFIALIELLLAIAAKSAVSYRIVSDGMGWDLGYLKSMGSKGSAK